MSTTTMRANGRNPGRKNLRSWCPITLRLSFRSNASAEAIIGVHSSGLSLPLIRSGSTISPFVTYPLCFSIFFVVADPLVRGLGRYNLDRSPVHDSTRGVVVEYLQLQVNFYSSSRPKMTTASQIVANLHKKLGKKC